MNTSLYLFPLPVLEEPPPQEQVEALLRQCGFLGASLGEGRYRVGENFFGHITFAGCSPHLKLEPVDEQDAHFTHLRFRQEIRPRLRVAPQRGCPRCRHCGAAVPGWKERLPQWQEDVTLEWRCAECGSGSRVAELDWRQYGVAARLLVEVRQVWPGEALPGDGLLRQLESGTGRRWAYAWAVSS